VVAPDAIRVVPSDDEISNLLHQAARYRSDTQTHTAAGVPAGPPIPPVDTTFRPAAANNVEVLGDRRSIGSRLVRAFTALLLAGCIGAAAIAWQVSGDLAKKLITKWTPQFVLTSLLSPEEPGLSAQPAPPDIQAGAAEAAPPQPAPLAQTAPAAALSPESASTARDLATVGREIEQLKASIEQLKASQQQMSREIAKTSENKASENKTSENKASENRASENKASEQNLRPKAAAISAPPPRPAAARTRKPMPPFPPPQAAAAPTAPQAAAPYLSRQVEPEPPATAQPQADPELASVPRPPMPIRPSIGSFIPQ
jgi:hypothetical protein